MTVNELSSRVERLERENRRTKGVGLALVGAALAAPLIGAATPNEVPEVISARRFQVVDETGRVRAGVNFKGFGLEDENDQVRALMSLGGFHSLDEKGAAHAVIASDGLFY